MKEIFPTTSKISISTSTGGSSPSKLHKFGKVIKTKKSSSKLSIKGSADGWYTVAKGTKFGEDLKVEGWYGVSGGVVKKEVSLEETTANLKQLIEKMPEGTLQEQQKKILAEDALAELLTLLEPSPKQSDE